MKKYSGYKKYTSSKALNYARNELIKSKELRVIDDAGEQLGILKTEEALEIAKSKELDLVEVSPNAKPPVAKILKWSKFKYQQEKKMKESKGKRIDQKEMWFKAYIDTGDLKHKIKKVIEFLSKKHPVKITVRAKGRTDRSNMQNLIDKILQELDGYIEEVDSRPKYEGRNLSTIVRPLKNLNKQKSDEEKNKNT